MRKLFLWLSLALGLLFSAHGITYLHHVRQFDCKVGTETKSGMVDGKFTTLDATISRDFFGRCALSIIQTHGLRVERTFAIRKPQGGWVLISSEVEGLSSYEKRPR